jgi:hypothetical protein
MLCSLLHVRDTPIVEVVYNIVSEGDLLDAARRLDAAAKNLAGTVRAQSAPQTPQTPPVDESTAVSY